MFSVGIEGIPVIIRFKTIPPIVPNDFIFMY